MKHLIKLCFFSGFALIILDFSSVAQTITRTPYLQLGTPNSMVIRWRTDVDVIGKINYGTGINSLHQSATGNSATKEHEIKITGLLPNTVYYYDVGTASQVIVNADSSTYFKTSPAPGSRQPVRIWAIGDFGNGALSQYQVRDAYLKYTNSIHTDAWIWMGDNAYGDGTDAEYQTKVFEVYQDVFKNTVAWPSPGNHDYGSIDLLNQGPYYDIFTLPEQGEAGGEPSGEEGYYSFDYGNVHFISLNSEWLPWTLLSSTAMTNWLEDDLVNNDKDWVIAYWHQPPYTKGSHDSDDLFGRMGMMRANINPVLEEYGVDLVLGGHSHCYERSHLIKGHYGQSNTFNASMIVDDSNPYIKYTDGAEPNKGTIYAVVGVSGQLSTSGNLDHPAMFFSTYDYNGSLVIDIDSNVLSAKFLTSNDSIADEFTIEKTQLTTSVPGINPKVQQVDVVYHFDARLIEVRLELSKKLPVGYRIYDMEGKLVMTKNAVMLNEGTHQNTFQVTDLVKGVYLVNVIIEDQIITKKIFIE